MIGAHGARASIVFVLDERERIDAARLGFGRRVTLRAQPSSRGVSVSIEQDGVRYESPILEDAGERVLVGGIETKLDLLADQLGADLEQLASEADRAVLSDLALLAMEKDFVEIGAGADLLEVLDLIERRREAEPEADGSGRDRVLRCPLDSLS